MEFLLMHPILPKALVDEQLPLVRINDRNRQNITTATRCILHLTFTHPKGAPLLQWADTHNLPSIFEGIQIPVLDYLNDVGVDALGDVPEGSAGGGGLHVVDDVPDDGDADEQRRWTSGTQPSFPPLKMTNLLLHWLG